MPNEKSKKPSSLEDLLGELSDEVDAEQAASMPKEDQVLAEIAHRMLRLERDMTMPGSATSAAAVLGDASVANRYLTSTDVKAAGVTDLTVTGYKSDGGNLTLALAKVGATTAGAGFVVVKYIIDGRCNEIQTH